MKIPSEKKLFNFLNCFLLILLSTFVSVHADNARANDARTTTVQINAKQSHQLESSPKEQIEEEAPHQSAGDQLKAFIAFEREKLAAKGFRTELKIGNIDPRLGKRECSKPIAFSFNQNPLERAHNTILMQCQQEKPWKLFVTMELKVFAQRLVASQGIARGATIDASQLKQASVQVNRIKHGGFSNVKLVHGMIAKHSIRAERLITADLLLPPLLVDRGDEVLIVAANNKIKIKMQGVAMSKGRKGQQIRIKNKQSQRIISAYVEDRGLVTVNL